MFAGKRLVVACGLFLCHEIVLNINDIKIFNELNARKSLIEYSNPCPCISTEDRKKSLEFLGIIILQMANV